MDSAVVNVDTYGAERRLQQSQQHSAQHHRPAPPAPLKPGWWCGGHRGHRYGTVGASRHRSPRSARAMVRYSEMGARPWSPWHKLCGTGRKGDGEKVVRGLQLWEGFSRRIRRLGKITGRGKIANLITIIEDQPVAFRQSQIQLGCVSVLSRSTKLSR